MKLAAIALNLALLFLTVDAAALATTSKTSTTKKSTSTKTSSTKTSSTKTTSIKTTTAKTTSTKTTTAKTTSTTTTSSAKPTGSASCTVTQYADLAAAVKSCTALTISGVTVPAGQFLDMSKLLTGTTVTFAGTTTWEYSSSPPDSLIKIGGAGITVTAAPGAVINGNGPAWWDGQGSNGGQAKPDHFITLSKLTSNSVVHDLYIKNWPVHCFQVTNCQDLSIYNINLDNADGNAPNSISGGLAAAHNSDGFDVSGSSRVTIRDSQVVNQDDCVAVTSGDQILVSDMYCDGGHGLSIGSVGGKSNNTVAGVTFQNSQVLNSQNAVRIKTNAETTGDISDVTYQNIAMSGITIYGIDVQQDYLNGGPTGSPTNGVTISGFTLKNVTGTVLPSARDYYILCGSGSCSDFSFSGVSVTGGQNDSCNYVPTGFSCA